MEKNSKVGGQRRTKRATSVTKYPWGCPKEYPYPEYIFRLGGTTPWME